MPADGRKLPREAAISYSIWMLLWVSVVLWAYGPANFFWLCNAAQFLILYAVWREDRLILSSQAGVVVLIGVIWSADLLLALALGGQSLTGITGYMFDPQFPLLARIFSLFHIGLPIFVLWLGLRLGYDRRGWWLQCALGAVLLIVGFLLTDPVRNVNYAVAPFHLEQVWLPHWLYLVLVAGVVQPVIFFVGHVLLQGLLRWLSERRSKRPPSSPGSA